MSVVINDSLLEDELYLENIEEYVNDENRIVTYKWLSRTLLVSVTAAKQMLQNYIKHCSSSSLPLTVLYTITGESHDTDKGVLVRLVSEEEKEECCRNLFSKVWSIQVYSVQKSIPKNTALLYNSDYQCMTEHLRSYIDWNTINSPAVTIRSGGGHNSRITTETKAISPLPSAPLIQRQEKKPITKESVDTFFSSSLQQPLPVDTTSIKKEGKENSHKTITKKTTEKKKQFFPASSKSSHQKTTGSTDKKKKTTSVKEKSTAITSNKKDQDTSKLTTPHQEDTVTKPSTVSIKEEEMEEENTITAQVKQVASKSATAARETSKGRTKGKTLPQQQQGKKKRKRIQNISSSDESDTEPNTKLSPQKVTTSPIKGTTSDIKSDQQQKKRKRVKRLVTKMFAEEDGSMVTEKHWEEVSTDASDNDEPSGGNKVTTSSVISPKKISAAGSSHVASSKKPPQKRSGKVGTTQSSLKSFFGGK